MIKVAFIGYRKWGYEIYKALLRYRKVYPYFDLDLVITSTNSEFKNPTKIKKFYVVDGKDNEKIYRLLKKNKIDLALFYSWSWIVKEPIVSEFICLCLHPSPLPKYRGGTPIQHQILDGKIKSAVSIFRMTPGIDDGPLYSQISISFKGNIEDIFRRMVRVGARETKKIIRDCVKGTLVFKPQKNPEKYPPWKRRKPEQSELTLEQISKMTFSQLNNFVRALTGPYPHAFINLDGGRLYLLELSESQIAKKSVLLQNTKIIRGTKIYVKLKGSYAKVKKYRYVKSIRP